MKILLIFVFVINLYSVELKEKIENLIEPAKKSKIVYIKYDPFVKGHIVSKRGYYRSSGKYVPRKPYFTAVLNEKVFINSKWYRVGNVINGYKIVSIYDNKVYAKKSGRIVRLKMRSSKKILKVKGL